MRRVRSAAVLAVLGVALISDASARPVQTVPRTAIAIVGGEAIPRTLYDAELNRRRYTYRLNRRPFPARGTAAFRAIRHSVVELLVWRVQLRQAAAAMGIRVDPREVERRINQLRQQRASNERQFERELRKLGLTVALLRADVIARMTEEAVRARLRASVVVEDDEVVRFYETNLNAFTTPATREVRLLVVRKRATAERLYAMIAGGANFAVLVRRYSIDRETRKRGGLTTVYSGHGDARIAVAFALPLGGVSAPIRCRGWCVVQALSEVRAGRLLELGEVAAGVREAVRETKTSAAVAAWRAAVEASYTGRILYAPGFEPSGR